MPAIWPHCDALAKLYDVELDDLIHYDQKQTGEGMPQKGKRIFGAVRVDECGQLDTPGVVLSWFESSIVDN